MLTLNTSLSLWIVYIIVVSAGVVDTSIAESARNTVQNSTLAGDHQLGGEFNITEDINATSEVNTTRPDPEFVLLITLIAVSVSGGGLTVIVIITVLGCAYRRARTKRDRNFSKIDDDSTARNSQLAAENVYDIIELNSEEHGKKKGKKRKSASTAAKHSKNEEELSHYHTLENTAKQRCRIKRYENDYDEVMVNNGASNLYSEVGPECNFYLSTDITRLSNYKEHKSGNVMPDTKQTGQLAYAAPLAIPTGSMDNIYDTIPD